MSENKKDCFLNIYQYYHFKNASNVQQDANIKRNCFAQYLLTYNNKREETRDLNTLDKKLGIYSDIVDNHSGLNNYADSMEVFTSNLNETNILRWNNELNRTNTSYITDSIKCCLNNDVNEHDLQLLLNTKSKLHSQEQIENKYLLSKPNTFNSSNSCFDSNLSTKMNKPNSTHANFTSNQGARDNKSNVTPTGNTHVFKTARDELEEQNLQKYGSHCNDKQQALPVEGRKKSLGIRRGPRSKFICPTKNYSDDEEMLLCKKDNNSEWKTDDVVDDKLKNIEPRMVELIKSEIMNSSANIGWDDIAGLEFAKMVIREVVVLPMLRPDIFTGLRKPPKGILLFGPPGTGKTLIGKCIASQSNSTFFSISASSLTSKWIGDGEKMVRAMFAVARCYQPAVIFIDEIDSLLSQRSETEHESTRRLKTEFLVQLDGAATVNEDRILVIGATNRPQELDEAARRRFVKRLYIPLPDKSARLEIVKHLMKSEKHDLAEENMFKIAELSDGYSGADMMNLCAEASLGPIRAIDINQIQSIETEKVRPISMEDFQVALDRVRATVSPSDLKQYVEWNQTYGAGNY